MRAAPASDHPIPRTGFWAGAGAGLAGLVGAVPVCWLGWHLTTQRWVSPEWRVVTIGLALLAGAAASVWVWRRSLGSPERRLRWDGTGWQLVDGDGHQRQDLGCVTVRMDLGAALLVSARTESGGVAHGATHWLPLERRSAPASWHGLRVALRRAGPELVGEVGAQAAKVGA